MDSGASGGFGFAAIIYLIVLVVMVAGIWKVFQKAGKPGWAAIVPIYNYIVILEIAGKPLWWIILMLISICQHRNRDHSHSPDITCFWQGCRHDSASDPTALHWMAYAGIWRRSIPGTSAIGSARSVANWIQRQMQMQEQTHLPLFALTNIHVACKV
jgi:hypothetical protein